MSDRPARRRAPLVIGLLLAFLAGSGGTWLLTGDESAEPDVVLDPARELDELPFPDADALGYADGPEAFCAAVTEVMTARNYLFLEAEESGDGISCAYITPVSSLEESGSNDVHASLFAVRGDTARDRYEALLRNVDQQHELGSPVAFGPLLAFPAGEAGWASHVEPEYRPGGEVHASFRSEDTTYQLTISGWQYLNGEPSGGLFESDGLAEAADIVTALGGGETPRPPLVSPFAGEEYPGLGQFDNPTLALEDENRCDALTEVLEAERPLEWGGGNGPVDPDDTIGFSCWYDPPSRVHEASSTEEILRVHVNVAPYLLNPRRQPREIWLNARLADELDWFGTTLWAPPVESPGYLITRENGYTGESMVQARYFAGDDVVTIEIKAHHDDRDYTIVRESEMVETLGLVLGALEG